MAVLVGDPAWRQAAEEELRQVIDDLLHTEKTHLAGAERLQGIHRRVGLLATLLATAGGATILSDSSKLAAGLLALAAALASGILTFLRPDREAEQHLAAGHQLAGLRVQARQMLNLDLGHLPADHVREAIRRLTDRKAEVDAAAPGTNSKDYSVARGRIVSGTFDRDR